MLIALGTVGFILLIRWFLTFLLPVKEEVFHIWLPLALPWVPIIIWLLPRTKILKYEKGDASMLIQIVAWLTITGMSFAANQYFKTASATISKLESIQELKSKPDYLSLKRIELDTFNIHSYTNFSTSGRYNDDFNIDIYFAAPFKNDQNVNKYWYGVKFHEEISNWKSKSEKEEYYKWFHNQCIQELNLVDFENVDYYEMLRHSDKRNLFLKAIKDVKKDVEIITAQEGKWADRNGSYLEWVFGILIIGIIVIGLAIEFAQFDKEEYRRQLNGIIPKNENLKIALEFISPTKGKFIIPILIIINVMVYLLMIVKGVHPISPNADELLQWGALHSSEVIDGQWWRLFTCTFLHAGLMHMAINIYGLIIAGIFIEPLYGKTRFALLYFLSGIGGSISSLYWNENVISVGASGAIFGVNGAILILVLLGELKNSKGLLFLFGPYVVLNIIIGLLLAGNIDNAAHIGGLIVGMVLGFLLYRNKKSI